MKREPRDQIIRVRVTQKESAEAELLALSERITVSDLMRKRLFSEKTGLDVVSSMQFLDETSATLAQIEKILSQDSVESEVHSLFKQVQKELIEARRLIANSCKSSGVSQK